MMFFFRKIFGILFSCQHLKYLEYYKSTTAFPNNLDNQTLYNNQQHFLPVQSVLGAIENSPNFNTVHLLIM